MEYEVFSSDYVLYPYITVHNDENLWLFTSIDTDTEWRGRKRRPGRYRSIAWIPGNLLSEGTMLVGAAMRTEEPFISHYYIRDAVGFQIVDSPDGDAARVDFGGKLPGIVRPYLKWSTEYSE
jgi:lipopolysaccharide transport system ATP-binding protein